VVEGNKVRQQVVSLGARQGKFFEVLNGLKGDEKLAITNLSQLATGVEVKVSPADRQARAKREAGEGVR